METVKDDKRVIRISSEKFNKSIDELGDFRDVVGTLITKDSVITFETNGGFYEMVAFDKESKKEYSFSEPIYDSDIETEEELKEEMIAFYTEAKALSL